MKVVMVCNLGISSTLLVKKLEAEIVAQGYDMQLEAVALLDVQDYKDIDFLLLSPQVSYASKQLTTVVSDPSNIYRMDSFEYSSLNAKQILQRVMAKLSERS